MRHSRDFPDVTDNAVQAGQFRRRDIDDQIPPPVGGMNRDRSRDPLDAATTARASPARISTAVTARTMLASASAESRSVKPRMMRSRTRRSIRFWTVPLDTPRCGPGGGGKAGIASQEFDQTLVGFVEPHALCRFVNIISIMRNTFAKSIVSLASC